jgi:hypothetical protein
LRVRDRARDVFDRDRSSLNALSGWESVVELDMPPPQGQGPPSQGPAPQQPYRKAGGGPAAGQRKPTKARPAACRAESPLDPTSAIATTVEFGKRIAHLEHTAVVSMLMAR